MLICHLADGGPASHEELMQSIETDLALSLLCVSKVLFHPVLDCVVLSLVTLIPRCRGQKCSESSPGIDNQCTS